MHINLQRNDLIKPLSYVAGAVEKRQTLPILSFVLLRQKANEITLTGTDLEIEIIAKVKAGQEGSGELTLPARKLLDICRALPEGATLDIRKEGEKAIVRSGKSRFSLLTLPANDFPDIQIAQWDQTVSIEQSVFRNILAQTNFCMAQQDMRYFLNGLLFDMDNSRLRVVGTDGHRMALSESTPTILNNEQRQVIVPRKGIHELMRLLEDSSEKVEIKLSSNHIQASTPTFTFISKLIDGKYPDYTKVIPTSQSKHVKVDRSLLKEALGRAAILSNEKYRGVRLGISDKSMKISTHNPEQEEAQEEIPIDYSGEPIEIGFNVSYVIEAISALQSKEIIVDLTDSNSSCTIHAADSKSPLYVIMPMRL
jgi:DNA polymerase-3 subunit beta